MGGGDFDADLGDLGVGLFGCSQAVVGSLVMIAEGVVRGAEREDLAQSQHLGVLSMVLSSEFT